MGLIDSHAHLTAAELFADVSAVLDRAAAAGVDHVIAVATDLADARRVLELAGRDARVFATIGIHPHEAGRATEEDWAAYDELIGTEVPVAVGEMGLDYHYELSDRRSQQAVFERQLALARSVGLPVIIHCREAHGDTVAMLINQGYAGRRVVFHCFSGTPSEAADIADHGWRISFTGMVTFKNAAELQAIATEYPVDQLMLETDAPYLSPEPVRRIRPNEPAHLAHTARFLASRRGMSFAALAQATSDNTRSFFSLDRRTTPSD